MVMPLLETASTVDASKALPLGVSVPRTGNPALDESRHASVNVAVYAPRVDRLEVVYQAPDGEWQSKKLPNITNGVHHGIVTGFPVGTRYGFRPTSKEETLPLSFPTVDLDDDGGQPLLLDPYGRAVDEHEGFLTSVRMSSDFDWGDDERPRLHWRNTIIYEAHVRGQSMLHPEVPEELRGTYAGMAHPAIIEHLKSLGITTVQLLPVHFHLDEPHLQNLGLTNYWGYNTAAFFAPHGAYASKAARDAGPQAIQDEFKGMVKLLHAAGLEVVLDVVYNHTAEGGPDGGTLSFRGLGEDKYYRTDGNGRYQDTTGCGNSMNFGEPRVVQLVLDSLRYWVDEFHIDGFRFDLAVTLCRNAANEFDPRHPFLVAIAADPVLSDVKLIAEPWDVGYGGWQTGQFPPGWVDWNDHFRDAIRTFWVADRGAIDAGGHGSSVARLADALSGSAGLFEASGRSRLASVNLITAHDGFTLADLTAYDRKHNEANGEQNRDGHGDNRSYNHGFEGRSEDENILAKRARTRRNLMASLMISLGVPMITAGDELARSQQGNNNAYCQDNAITWLDWTPTTESQAMLRSTKRFIRLRKEFLAGQPHDYPSRDEQSYMFWYGADGKPMSPEQWNDSNHRLVQLLLGAENGMVAGLVVINGGDKDIPITLPDVLNDAGDASRSFELRLTTADTHEERQGTVVQAGGADVAEAYSITIYRT
ncbi:glycogen debranching protein GlgX [Pseudarthrobacter sp. J75]|uniref:glycogen debranching protein GlgX n=1 Tax=unclassified Pseudarthrobacter TaxID=2647000 RepID=UPI002E81D4B4|nr:MULTISPECIES: glycogen debranching protein GlgX [unclassified Pseudarthrobacter]MEE2524656.1 glycogen debranching protein GlgX [Pseudarthrobacter sp. J47]MEE2530686.1 glycogen debranching protein GlgX [Pseudarthrobacter sp. J75]MEE2570947.1 glycogen debranching protein GlgX [Pseudarthrobacter sp. J64]